MRIAPSPGWLQRRLEAMGQRPINNVVDITNLVLFEFGQPLHAFDLDRLAGPAIRVRRARAGERFTTLDGKERTLDPEVLLICDREKPVAIAGVMGGAESEVRDGLAAGGSRAPGARRHHAAAAGVRVVPAAPHPPRLARARALDRGLEALRARRGPARRRRRDRALPGAAGRGLAGDDAGPGVRARLRAGRARAARAARLALPAHPRHRRPARRGDSASRGRWNSTVEPRAPHGAPAPPAWELEVEVPSWRAGRHDRGRPDRGGGALARLRPHPRGRRSRPTASMPRAARASAASSARGAPCWPAASPRPGRARWSPSARRSRPRPCWARAPDSLVRLANPMSREGEVLRPSPVAGLLRACAHNLRQGVPAVRLFEVGMGFAATAPRPGRTAPRSPSETLMLAAIVTGPRYAHAHDAAQQAVDFDEAKGLWEAWLEEMSVDTPEWRAYAAPGWKLGASAELRPGLRALDGAAAWASRCCAHGTSRSRCTCSWCSSTRCSGALPAAHRVTLPGRFPPVSRDLAFFVPVARAAARGRAGPARAAQAAGGEGSRLASIELFDVYTGPGTPEGMKSLAYALRFEHAERTLQEAEVQAIQDRMVDSRLPRMQRPTERAMTDTRHDDERSGPPGRTRREGRRPAAGPAHRARAPAERARPARRAEPGARAEAAGAGPGRDSSESCRGCAANRRDWQAERREVALRIETLVTKLERIEG